MYADDLSLISASVYILCVGCGVKLYSLTHSLTSLYDLQQMIDLCAIEAGKLDMKFNANKSQIIRIGQTLRKHVCHDISIGSSVINCVDELKYLG